MPRKQTSALRGPVIACLVLALAVASIGSAIAAIGARSSSLTATGAPASSLTLNRPPGVQQGDLLLASVSARLSSSTSVAAPSGWALVRRDACSGPGGVSLSLATYAKLATGSEPGSYTWGFGAASGAAGVTIAYSGVDTARPIEAVSGTVSRNSRWAKVDGVSSSSPNARAVAFLGRSVAVQVTAPSGMTPRIAATTSNGPEATVAGFDQVLANPGSTGTKSTQTGVVSACNVGHMLVLKEFAGTPPTPVPAAAAPSSLTAPALNGDAIVGETLRSTPGTWSGTQPMEIRYQWSRCSGGTCEPVPGATSSTYALTGDDLGKAVRSSVRATNTAGSAVAGSTASAVVQDVAPPTTTETDPPPAPQPPVATASPTLTGQAVVGSSLTVSNGTWSGADPMSYAYRWSRCSASACEPIPDATARTYAIVAGDQGFGLRATVTATNTAGSGESSSATTAAVAAAPAPSTNRVVVVTGQPWVCDGPVDLDLVKVTRPPADAIVLASGCTGRIARIEVDTWTEDGVKVQNQSNPAHDLVIGGGYVTCHAMTPGAHQDAMQAMGGARITFRNVAFDCLGNSNFFVNQAGSGATLPTDIVCEGCRLGGRSSTTLRVNVSLRSGARDSVGCTGRNVNEAFYFTSEAQSPVNAGNRQLPSGDPGCTQ